MNSYLLPQELIQYIKSSLHKNLFDLQNDLMDVNGYYQHHKESHPDWVEECPQRIEQLKIIIQKHTEWLKLFD